MQKTRIAKSLKAVRKKKLYFNKEKCCIVLYAEKSIENNKINITNKTRLNLYKNI